MQQQLKAVEIGHYVYGAFLCFTGLIGIVLILMGSFLSSDWLQAESGGDMPAWIGRLMSTFGLIVFIVVETAGILNFISGAMIAKRKNRNFSMVIAGLNCLNLPFGTLLGVFTFMALLNDEAEALYGDGAKGIPNK